MTIVNASLDLTKIPKAKIIKGKKGSYINVTMFVNDEVDQFGNNASIILSQTKEEREAKQSRVYLGNGRTAALNNQPKQEEVVDNDLPF
jgi:hypothetical protein|tara:strand:- start:513 stop:779 length:267 start_codon:yes stop_codon:yes gene_type:complete